jgi:hypothetical protein
VATMLMELTWTTVWYRTICRPEFGLPETVVLLGLAFLGSFGLTRAMRGLGWQISFRRILFSTWVLLYLLVSMKVFIYPQLKIQLYEWIMRPFIAIFISQTGNREFWHVLILGLLTLRGATLASMGLDHQRVTSSFLIGLGMILFYGMGRSSINQVETSGVFFSFIALGLISLSTAAISDLSDLRGGRVPRMSMAWSIGIILSAIFVAGISTAVGLMLGNNTISLMLKLVVEGVFTLIVTVVAVILLPVLYILFTCLTLIAKPFLSLIDQKAFAELFQNAANSFAMQQRNLLVLENFNSISRIIILGGVIFSIYIATLVILKFKPNRRRLTIEESSQPAARNPNKPFSFPTSIKKIRFRSRRFIAAEQIRRVYSELMNLCEQLGHTRPPAVTPTEFIKTLEAIFPAESEHISRITFAYINLRYGEIPENTLKPNEVLESWEHLKRSGQKILAMRKRLLKDSHPVKP